MKSHAHCINSYILDEQYSLRLLLYVAKSRVMSVLSLIVDICLHIKSQTRRPWFDLTWHDKFLGYISVNRTCDLYHLDNAETLSQRKELGDDHRNLTVCCGSLTPKFSWISLVLEFRRCMSGITFSSSISSTCCIRVRDYVEDWNFLAYTFIYSIIRRFGLLIPSLYIYIWQLYLCIILCILNTDQYRNKRSGFNATFYSHLNPFWTYTKTDNTQ